MTESGGRYSKDQTISQKITHVLMWDTSSELLGEIWDDFTHSRNTWYDNPSETISYWQNEQMCRAFSEHPHTPERVLLELLEEESYSVNRKVVLNPAVTPDIMLAVWEKHPGRYDDDFAHSQRTLPWMLRKLANSKRVYTRIRVAGNPSAPLDVLGGLLEDEDFEVCTAAQETLMNSPEFKGFPWEWVAEIARNAEPQEGTTKC